MLVAGAANLKIERIWTSDGENPRTIAGPGGGSANESSDSFLSAAPQVNSLTKAQQFQHRWTQVPEISMELHLSPQVYFQVQESLNMVQKHPKAARQTVKSLIADPSLRTLFAGLVATNIKFSNFMSGVNYQLDANYKRLKRERHFNILRIVSHIKKKKSGRSLR